jgi:hypothetical protein
LKAPLDPAIVTLYTAVLAVAFSVADHPLPWTGLLPAFFLGLAITFAAGFLAYLPKAGPEHGDAGAEEAGKREKLRARGSFRDLLGVLFFHMAVRLSPRVRAAAGRTPTGGEGSGAAHDVEEAPPGERPLGDRLATRLILWTRRTAIQRSGWLRAGVVSLAVALFLLPAPFIDFGEAKAPSEPTAWPALSANAPADLELQKIVYQAQVAEVAKQREAPAGRSSRNWIWIVLAGAGLGLVIVVPEIQKREKPEEKSTDPTDPGLPPALLLRR